MRQIIMTSPGKIEFREVQMPEPGADQVLLRMKRIGVCGSDIHVYHGKHPYTSYPVVQGHEASGEIVKLGPGVEGLSLGQKATFMPQVTCGTCYPWYPWAVSYLRQSEGDGFPDNGARRRIISRFPRAM